MGDEKDYGMEGAYSDKEFIGILKYQLNYWKDRATKLQAEKTENDRMAAEIAKRAEEAEQDLERALKYEEANDPLFRKCRELLKRAVTEIMFEDSEPAVAREALEFLNIDMIEKPQREGGGSKEGGRGEGSISNAPVVI